ncbi:MAG: SCO family protein [Deltaproteobacteria bacterium]|nr:SCO family protein [Deltaproteobacteria bacterium]
MRLWKTIARHWRVALLCGLWWIAPSPAHAHKFGGPNDPCERKLGASLIHITLYQPQFDPDAEYCDEVPREGNTVFVLDTQGDELRRVPIGVRILAIGRDGSMHPAVSLAPVVYPRGVVDTQVNLAEGFGYQATVSIGSPGGAGATEYSFPIRVRAWYRALVMPFLLVLGVLALVAISIIRYRRSAILRGRRNRRAAASARLALAAVALGILAAGCHPATKATATLPNVQLIDDHGQRVELSSLKGKVVMLNFVHVGCPGMCDTLINKFGQIADAIGPELGSRVVLVTITNDPEHDRPALLLKLARDRRADMSGWLFLTGTAADVARITTAFGVDNRRLPDGSPNHITRVFMLGPDLRQQREYAGMAMNSQRVVAEIKDQVERGGA